MKGVKRFDKKGKLSPRYVGPFRILSLFGKVAYELELLSDLALVHPVFHVSLLKKCIGDPAVVVPLESANIQNSLSYEEVLVEILDHQVRRIRNKEVPLVKVLWRNQSIERATWEAEADMRTKYPHLFSANSDLCVKITIGNCHWASAIMARRDGDQNAIRQFPGCLRDCPASRRTSRFRLAIRLISFSAVAVDRMMEELHSQGKTVEQIAECLKHVPLHPRTISAIESAHDLGCDLKIVSDANQFYIETILKHHRLDRCFSEIITNPTMVDGDGRLRIFPYHDMASFCGCNLCPPNLCKGLVIEKIRASRSEKEKSRFIYLGDGRGDYCPTLKLDRRDYVMPRKGFPLWDRLLSNPNLLKADTVFPFFSNEAYAFNGFSVSISRVCSVSFNMASEQSIVDQSNFYKDESHEQRETCNATVLSWLMISVSEELLNGIVSASAFEGTDPVSTYFAKLKNLWSEYDVVIPAPSCTCPTSMDYADYLYQLRLIQFLSGLNDSYDQPRRQILFKGITPTLNQAYATMVEDEIQQLACATAGSDKTDPTAMHTIAASYGVEICNRLGITELGLELDSQILTNMLLNKSSNILKLKRRIDKIPDAMSLMRASVKHCFREANQVADNLAKYAANRDIELHLDSYPASSREAKGHYQLDKSQLTSLRIRYDKANFFVS
ncbi:Inorganic pyrophosphatase 3 [Capsicum annuum]|nr:Inorganic pyrophosphatase 3 [Capsicum annuum]